ncbi:MAG: choline/ethanolamine kinase family protein [Sporichthyaceae bacterium]
MTSAEHESSTTAPPHVLARLHDLLDDLPALSGTPRTVEALDGGLTNFNFKVSTPERTAVVRLSSSDSDELAIDRDAEHVNSVRAAESGAAPAVLDYRPEHRALVVAWVNGTTLTSQDLHDERNVVRAATVCRQLHSGPRFVSDFDMFDVQPRYLAIVKDRGYRLPSRYLDLQPEVDRIADALAVRSEATVPCNNDLLAANFIDDGNRLWVIDYEYAGNNDPCFELGNIWSESDLPIDHLELLVDSYYGQHLRHKVARARLLGLMAKYGWTLWASIQSVVSPIEFDFWSWGMEKYERALEEFDAAGFTILLDEARRPD